MNEQKSKYSGIPISEKEYAEWQKAFSDIELASDELKKKENKKTKK
jgi:hypothetical protein